MEHGLQHRSTFCTQACSWRYIKSLKLLKQRWYHSSTALAACICEVVRIWQEFPHSNWKMWEDAVKTVSYISPKPCPWAIKMLVTSTWHFLLFSLVTDGQFFPELPLITTGMISLISTLLRQRKYVRQFFDYLFSWKIDSRVPHASRDSLNAHLVNHHSNLVYSYVLGLNYLTNCSADWLMLSSLYQNS